MRRAPRRRRHRRPAAPSPARRARRKPSARRVNLLAAAVLGVVQGVTEFLPVSSTAHLLLAERLLGHSDPGGVFTVTIQLGSILAVMWAYRGKLAALLRGILSDLDSRRFAIAIILATIPALIAGALLSSW